MKRRTEEEEELEGIKEAKYSLFRMAAAKGRARERKREEIAHKDKAKIVLRRKSGTRGGGRLPSLSLKS